MKPVLTIITACLVASSAALPAADPKLAKTPTVGGPCGENHGDSKLCKDPKFPYCVPNYYMVSLSAGIPGKTIFVCEKTNKGQI
jgi:hypothetical protein